MMCGASPARRARLQVKLPIMWFPLVGIAMLACPSIDPQERAAIEYANALQPLMLENSLLAERMLFMAARVYNNDLPKEGGLTPTWTSEIVPLARHLAVQAENTPVPDEWKEDHAALVVIWTDRANGYQGLGEALVLADRKRWKAARDLLGSVTQNEERWFMKVNAKLRPMEFDIDAYP